ncbi:MAG: hypothetical protein GC164_16125 [Phycisphaera sp.]|nr:hypothetical protein [Phycisphaera sp.]
MLQLMQPLLAALIGAAMSLFGLLHTVQLFPTPVIWHQFVVSMPPLMAVLLFAACVALALGGMAMLITGLRDTRRRLTQLRRVPWEKIPGGDGASASPYGRQYDQEDWR